MRVTVPPVSSKDAKQLLDTLAESPVIITRIFNRELDPAVLDQAKQLGIAVFPEKWKDLDMHCSCPDWAVPCKHLAAAIYLVSREIDGNPFLVFSLRGIDLTAALKERNIAIEREAKAALPMVKDMLALQTDVEGQPGEISAADTSSALNALDFSSLPNLADTLVRILPEKPAFYPYGDFHLLYGKTEVPPVFRLPRGGVSCYQLFFLLSIKPVIQKPYWRLIALSPPPLLPVTLPLPPSLQQWKIQS